MVKKTLIRTSIIILISLMTSLDNLKSEQTVLIENIGAHASSQLSDRYAASFAIDGNSSTTWSEGVDGSGIGEWIVVYFDGDSNGPYSYYYVKEIQFTPGFNHIHPTYGDLFNLNNRIKKAKIILREIDVMENVHHQMEIIRTFNGSQREVSIPVADFKANEVIIEIMEVYPGSRWDDTCISEIEVYGSFASY